MIFKIFYFHKVFIVYQISWGSDVIKSNIDNGTNVQFKSSKNPSLIINYCQISLLLSFYRIHTQFDTEFSCLIQYSKNNVKQFVLWKLWPGLNILNNRNSQPLRNKEIISSSIFSISIDIIGAWISLKVNKQTSNMNAFSFYNAALEINLADE